MPWVWAGPWQRAERVGRDAAELMSSLGESAYDEARSRARERRTEGDRRSDRHWGRVAVEIARRTGREIGGRTADRYPPIPHAAALADSALADDLVEIAQAIADMTVGATTATTLHNAAAAVHRLVEARPGPTVHRAGLALRKALEDLARDREGTRAVIAAGRYPELAIVASRHLQAMRKAVLEAT